MKNIRCKLGLHKSKRVHEYFGSWYYQCELCGKRGMDKYSNFNFLPGSQQWLNGEFETVPEAYEAVKAKAMKKFEQRKMEHIEVTDVVSFNYERIDGYLEKEPDYSPSFYIDVDNTLINPDNSVNQSMVALIKDLKQRYGNKISIIVWSSGGKKYASEAVDKADIKDYVDVALSKPFYIIDDCGDFWHFGLLTIIDWNCAENR